MIEAIAKAKDLDKVRGMYPNEFPYFEPYAAISEILTIILEEYNLCIPYWATQDRRTQIPRWNEAQGSNFGIPNPNDQCKKVYLDIELIALFGREVADRPESEDIHTSIKIKDIYRMKCACTDGNHIKYCNHIEGKKPTGKLDCQKSNDYQLLFNLWLSIELGIDQKFQLDFRRKSSSLLECSAFGNSSTRSYFHQTTQKSCPT